MPLSNNFVERATGADMLTVTVNSTASLIVAATSARKGLSIYNPLNEPVYIDVADTVTPVSCMVAIPANEYYELPFSDQPYIGDFYGVTANGSGAIEIRQFA